MRLKIITIILGEKTKHSEFHQRSRSSKTPFWPQNIAVLQNC